MVFVFHIFVQPPLLFEASAMRKLETTPGYQEVRGRFDRAFEARREAAALRASTTHRVFARAIRPRDLLVRADGRQRSATSRRASKARSNRPLTSCSLASSPACASHWLRKAAAGGARR